MSYIKGVMKKNNIQNSGKTLNDTGIHLEASAKIPHAIHKFLLSQSSVQWGHAK